VSEPTIVCVLGMHRSGTSLVSRVLNVLGLDLGPEEHLMRPNSENPTGYWESRPIKRINDEILSRLGGSWFEPPERGVGWEHRPALAGPRREARELIAADFSDSELWGFKDPRNSLTLPFWQRFLEPMRYVICFRNPLDVAASLETREEEPVPFEQGIGLWLTYVRGALAHTAGHPRELVFYEDLMADPGPVVDRLARFIGRPRSAAAKPDTRAEIRAAVAEGLWHHRTTVPDVVDATGLAFHVKALYLALRLFVPGEESVGAEVLDLFGAYAADAGHRLAQLDASRAELEKAREQSRLLERERAELERRLSERGADLERVRKARAEEQELRRELEAELQAKREELDRPRQAADAEAADPEAAAATAGIEATGADPGDTHDPLVSEIRATAQEVIPSGATVLVAGKGDDALLRLDGSRGWHFPMAADGRYAGHHPAGDTAAIAQLEALRARGADHLLLSATTLWWLDHYRGLRRHLAERYVPLLEHEHCVIYRLSAGDGGDAAGAIPALKRAVACVRVTAGRNPSILDWDTELGISDQFPEVPVFVPPGEAAALPYLDGTVDIVVVASADPTRVAEARRVAEVALIRVDPDSAHRAELEWLASGPAGWGEDTRVTLIPNGDAPPWDATVSGFAETLKHGFTGELSVVGESATLGRASERAAAAGVRIHPIQVGPEATLAQRASAATTAADQRVQILVTAPAVPLPDWLPPVLALFRPERDAGAVGTRILSGDGVLQEAGGIRAADGSLRRRGEGDHDPDKPEYGFVRRVDFCSPPLIATRRDLFERLSGFDERCVAPVDALVDFSLRAGQSAAPVYYQPQARMVTIGGEHP
jgi:hypothetical protein